VEVSDLAEERSMGGWGDGRERGEREEGRGQRAEARGRRAETARGEGRRGQREEGNEQGARDSTRAQVVS